jgi:hypothetical protein
VGFDRDLAIMLGMKISMFGVGYGILIKHSVLFQLNKHFGSLALTVKSLPLFLFCVRLLNTEDTRLCHKRTAFLNAFYLGIFLEAHATVCNSLRAGGYTSVSNTSSSCDSKQSV